MKLRSWLTLTVLGAVVLGLIILLFLEATRGPMFRAEEYDSYDECIANIPIEWRRGSVEHMGAEAACGYLHAQSARPRGG
jgi:hypothetical protein